MATNRLYENARNLHAIPTDGGVLSGDPLLVGNIGGVALVNQAADGSVTFDTRGAYNLTVKGDGVAVAAGDIVYYTPGSTPVLTTVSGTGSIRFGYALGIVASGATSIIPVKLGY